MLAGTLADQQQTFIDLLLDESLPLPAGWGGERVAIYRNAYRSRVVDAIRETYPRTERWVGEDAFRRAAVHHVIQRPPRSWTLDAVGQGMPDTLAELFSKDPEVSELAWLEWAMHECFVSADRTPVDVAGFQAATADFRDTDWAELRLTFIPGTQVTSVMHRVDVLWHSIGGEDPVPEPRSIDYKAKEPLACVVWRQGLTPVCAPLASWEGGFLSLMLAGASYGDACSSLAGKLGTEVAVQQAGAMLGRWIHNGMLAAVQRD